MSVTSDVWEQDVPIGGADTTGELPAAAIAAVPVGVATVREVPALRHTSGAYAIPPGTAVRVLGRVPQRRAWYVSADAGPLVLGDTEQQAVSGQGYWLHAPTAPHAPFRSAAEVWIANHHATDVVTVSFWAELDQG
jgi:hypothetical protein